MNEVITNTLSHLHYYIAFYLPLGIIGVWRWSVWLFKEIVAMFYKVKTTPYKATVSVVTPVYNEDPEVFLQALESWKSNGVDEIVAVVDYTDETCIKVFKNFQKHYKNGKLLVTKVPGKRPALAWGMKEASSEIVALVDSDTIWLPGVKDNGLCPFNDPKVGGVATRQNVMNPQTLAQKLFDILLDLRYYDDMAFLGASGDYLRCLSGRTAFYRLSAVLPLLDGLENETFMGQKVISGDDKCLTYLVQGAGWKTCYQSNCVVLTPGMEKFSQFRKQKIRWTRNSWRADLKAFFTQKWVWKNPLFAIGFLDGAIQPFTLLLSPIFFIVSLLLGHWTAALIIFVWWHLSRALKLQHHFRRRPQDIVLLPIYILFSFYMAIVKIYALLTLNTQGWITRWDANRLNKLNWLQNNLPTFATVNIVLFLFIGVAYTRGVFGHYNLIEGAPKALAFNTTKPIEINKAVNSELLKDKEVAKTLAISEGDVNVFDQDYLSGFEPVLTRYETVSGDSIFNIATKYDIPTQELIKFNASIIPNMYSLDEGLVLNIPHKDFVSKITTRKNYKSTIINRPYRTIVYDEATDTITVRGRGNKVTLDEIRTVVGDEQLQKLENNDWFLKANLNLESGITMKISDADTNWLKIQSNKDGFKNIIIYDSRVTLDKVRITSWDDLENDFDRNHKDGRSYILAKSDSRLDIYNSDISYLGYKLQPLTEGGTYGVSWRIPDNTLGHDVVTGEVINSKFHHNYFGVYSFGATGMVFKNNEFYENIEYGLDPHDDSNYFIVDSNIARDNGTHGIIFSKRCIYNVITNNQSFNNKGHGIMLHESSHYNVVENNISIGNQMGVALYNSSNNLIRNNKISDNKTGIRINNRSVNNLIEGNEVKSSKSFGIYMYEDSGNNYVTYNKFINNDVGVYIKSNNNEISSNTIRDNRTGVYFINTATGNKLIENLIRSNKKYGIYTKSDKVIENYMWNNNMIKNKENISFTRNNT